MLFLCTSFVAINSIHLCTSFVAIAEYWRCESAGLNSENSCDGLRDSLRQLASPGLTSASYLLLGIFPAVNLIFAVNVKERKQKFKTWCGQAATFYPSKR